MRVVLFVALVGCGGKAVVDGQARSDSTSTDGGAGGAATTTSTGSGADGPTTSTTSTNGCQGAPCGTFCEACASECLPGHCNGVGSCMPWDDEGSDPCPPADDVHSGASCTNEASLCPSHESCSGYLLCMCGVWTLIHPC